MDVQLTFNARQQFDKGGPLSAALKQATTLLEADALPPGASRLTKEEAIDEGLLDEEEVEEVEEAEEDDDDDDDDDDADDSGEINVWVISIGNTSVYFSQPDEDQPKRLILRAV